MTGNKGLQPEIYLLFHVEGLLEIFLITNFDFKIKAVFTTTEVAALIVSSNA